MNTKVLGIGLVLSVIITSSIATGAVLERSSTLQSVHPNAQAMRLDACPYYPSPVVCRHGTSAAD
jgi:hypothetical protein